MGDGLILSYLVGISRMLPADERASQEQQGLLANRTGQRISNERLARPDRYEAGASGGWVALGGCWVGSVSFEFPIGAGSGPGPAGSKAAGCAGVAAQAGAGPGATQPGIAPGLGGYGPGAA